MHSVSFNIWGSSNPELPILL